MTASVTCARLTAFTLMEMLVVMAIIGMLTALSLPHLKGLNRSNSMTAAVRQLLDDVSFARQRAMSGRTTVFMVFMPPVNPAEASYFSGLNGVQMTNMLTGQQISYAFFTRRAVGDQPGQETPRYVTKWHSLPDSIFIPWYKFDVSTNTIDNQPIPQFAISTNLPVPTVDGPVGPRVPYIAFDYQGRLVREDGSPTLQDEYIPLAKGSLFFARDANGLIWDLADARETPPDASLANYNLIHIDWLTGRAKVERLEIK